MITCKFLVVGSGETGLNIALQLAQQGHEVVLTEENNIGGSYLYSYETPQEFMQDIAHCIFNTRDLFEDNSFPNSQQIQKQIIQKVKTKIKKIRAKINKFKNLKILYGKTTLESKRLVEVINPEERNLVGFEYCVLATGRGKMSVPKIQGLDKINFLYQHNAFFAEELPKSLGIIGCTIDNLKVANIFANLGVKVSFFEKEYTENLMKNVDPKCLNYYFQQLLSKGVEFYFGAHIKRIEKKNSLLHVIDDEKNLYKVDNIYLHVKETFSDEMNLNKIGIQNDSNGIITNSTGQASHKHIWAFGKCSQLNRIYHQAIINQFLESFDQSQNPTNKRKGNYLVLLSNIPQIASLDVKPLNFPIIEIDNEHPIATFGLTYKIAFDKYGSPIKFTICRNSQTAGFLKIIYHEANNQILGISLAGDFYKLFHSSVLLALYKNFSYKDYLNFLSARLILDIQT